MNKLLYCMWCGCHTKEGVSGFHEGKGFQWLDIMVIFVSESTEAFFCFPLPVSSVVILLSNTRGTVPFSLVIYFPPFHLQLSVHLLSILACCGTEYVVRAQPALWNQWPGKSTKQNFSPYTTATKASEKYFCATG